MKPRKKKEAVKAAEDEEVLCTGEECAAEEQGILPEETSEEKKIGMELGEKDDDLETEEGQEEQVEDDEVEPWEAGFVKGASDEGQLAKDALTGEPLMDVDDVVEAEIDGKTYRFASERNARKFREKKKGKK